MKNKFTLIALLALFLAGTYTIYAQEENEYTPTPETAPAIELKPSFNKESHFI